MNKLEKENKEFRNNQLEFQKTILELTINQNK